MNKEKAKKYVVRNRPDLGIRPGVKVIPNKKRDERRPSTKELTGE
jgi:hypothetical protein